MRGPLAFFERHIRVGKADADKEGYNASNGLEFANFDVVVGRAGPRGDEKLFQAIIRDRTHDPDPVITRALLVRRFLAQDLGAMTAVHELAESGFCDHIWCFYFPVHDCGHTSLILRRMIACPP